MEVFRVVVIALALAVPSAAVARAPFDEPPPVKLQDEARFAPALVQDLEYAQCLANHFRDFAIHEAPKVEETARKTIYIYASLRQLKEPRTPANCRLTELGILYYSMGEAAYAKGRVAPPVPVNYREPFRVWLRKNGYKIEP